MNETLTDLRMKSAAGITWQTYIALNGIDRPWESIDIDYAVNHLEIIASMEYSPVGC